MSTHDICFYGEITKIIPKLSSNTLLICSSDRFNHFVCLICFAYHDGILRLGDGAGKLPVPGRPATFAYNGARACCACSRCRTGGLYFSSIFSF